MSVLHELAECFEMSEREVCVRAGYSPFDVKRILEADTTIYPGEFQKLMKDLRIMSLQTRDYEIQSATTVSYTHLLNKHWPCTIQYSFFINVKFFAH